MYFFAADFIDNHILIRQLAYFFKTLKSVPKLFLVIVIVF